jgi:crotonobetainyl-CoA:carnitine CoA-transferase CaiB-like acyl-CoA transferase
MLVPPSRYPEVAARLEAIFATRPAAHWVDSLADAGAAVGPTHEIADLFTDRHVKARGSITGMGNLEVVRTPIRLLDAQGGEDVPAITPPPALGEHTHAALSAAGLGAAEISALREAGVI